MKFRPRSRAGKFDWLIVCAVATALLMSVFFLRDYPNRVITGMIVLSLLGVFLYFYYLVMSAKKMMYTVQNNGIRIQYGFLDVLLPYEEILNVEVVRRSNWKKLFGVAWKDYFAGYFKENKYGIVQIYGTTNLDMVYIKTRKARYAITPADNQLFFEELSMRWKKPAADKKDALYSERVERKRLWQEPKAFALSLIGFAAGIAQIVLAIYVWVSGRAIGLLDYSLTGDVMQRGAYYELLVFPLATLFFVIRMSWSADVLLQNGVQDKKRFQMFMLLIALVLLVIMTSIIFVG